MLQKNRPIDFYLRDKGILKQFKKDYPEMDGKEDKKEMKKEMKKKLRKQWKSLTEDDKMLYERAHLEYVSRMNTELSEETMEGSVLLDTGDVSICAKLGKIIELHEEGIVNNAIDSEEVSINKEDSSINKGKGAINKEDSSINKEDSSINKEDRKVNKEDSAINKEDNDIKKEKERKGKTKCGENTRQTLSKKQLNQRFKELVEEVNGIVQDVQELKSILESY